MCVFFFNDTATTEIYTLSLHDALPIYDLSLGGVYAALAYYHDHKEDVDRRIKEGEAFSEEIGRAHV